MDNKTVWNRLVVPLKPRIELSYLDWKPKDTAPMVGGHNILPNNMACLEGPEDFVSSVSSVTTRALWDCTTVCAPYHCTASALEGSQVSFNLPARVVLGLN